MKLDKFQQFIKDGKYEPDLNVVQAKSFMWGLAGGFQSQFNDLESSINGSIDISNIIANSLCQTEFLSNQTMDNAIKYHVNELIKTTIEEIEDIEDLQKKQDYQDSRDDRLYEIAKQREIDGE